MSKELKLKGSTGNGSKQLYIGESAKSELYDEFFNIDSEPVGETNATGGERRDIQINAFALYEDLIKYLKESKVEFQNPKLKYENDLPKYYDEIYTEIEQKIKEGSNKEDINLSYRSSDSGNRYYLTQKDRTGENQKIYQYMTQSLLPEISLISVVKVRNLKNREISLYFKPILNYEYSSIHHEHTINAEILMVQEKLKKKRLRKKILLKFLEQDLAKENIKEIY